MSKIGIVLNNGIAKCKTESVVSEAQMSEKFYRELINCETNPILITSLRGLSSINVGSWSLPSGNTITLGKAPSGVILKIFFYLRIALKSLFLPLPSFVYFFYGGNVSLSLLTGTILRRKKYAIYFRNDIRQSGWFYRVASKIAFKKASFIIATGSSLANYARQFNANVEEVVPMMNVTKDDLYYKTCFRNTNPFRILFYSRIEERKGVIESIQAVKFLLKNGYDITLNIAGGVSQNITNKLSEEIAGFEKNIRLLGKITDRKTMKRLFQNADLYVLPTYFPEGFPRVLYEAMTFSTPIVTTNIQATEGFMQHNINCLKVPPKNHYKLAKAIEKLITEPGLRERLSKNSYTTMKTLFERIENNSHAKQLINKAKLFRKA